MTDTRDPFEHVTTDAHGVRKWGHRTIPPEAIMVRRDEVREGDVLYSSHGYNLVITNVRTGGTEGQTTELVGDLHEAGGPSRNEIYPSDGYVPVVRTIDEGDHVVIRARVARADREQALVEITSSGGPFSLRVPLAEIAPTGSSYPDADIVAAAGLEGMARGRDRVSWEDVARAALQELGIRDAADARARATEDDRHVSAEHTCPACQNAAARVARP